MKDLKVIIGELVAEASRKGLRGVEGDDAGGDEFGCAGAVVCEGD